LPDHQAGPRAQLCREAGEIKPQRFAALHLASPWLWRPRCAARRASP
jgi:hypothetical protein